MLCHLQVILYYNKWTSNCCFIRITLFMLLPCNLFLQFHRIWWIKLNSKTEHHGIDIWNNKQFEGQLSKNKLYTNVSLNEYMSVCISIYVWIHTGDFFTYIHLCVCVYVCMHMCMCMHVCVCMCMHVYVWISDELSVYLFVHIYFSA